jgi:dihydroflavonol-4-reductase
MKIAITGSTGHIATSVIPLLTGNNNLVRTLQHAYVPALKNTHTEIFKGDLNNPLTLNGFTDGCDVVVHCAARISINSNADPLVYETNVNGTINIFNAAKKAGVKRFIYVSSIHAYHQLPVYANLNEYKVYCTGSAPKYDQSKRDAQKYVLENANAAMEVVVVNPTCVIGPPDPRPSLMGKAIIDMYNKKIPSLINGGFDFCDVRDVAQGIVQAIDKGRNGESYLLSGKWYSLAALYTLIMNLKHEQHNIPVLPAWLAYLGLPFIQLMAVIKKQEPLYTKESLGALLHGNKNISYAKAMNELGYSCRPLAETVSDVINWYRKSGMLV